MDSPKYLVKYSYEEKKIPKSIRVIVGGISGMIATILLHPLDLVKIRLQTHYSQRCPWLIFRNIWKCEGPKGLYKGLSAGIMRQATNTTTRHAVYYWLHEHYVHNYGKLTLKDKILISSYASMAGALAGTPSELILIRTCAYGPLDPCAEVWQRPRLYQGLRDAIQRIVRTDGVRGLWRGGTLTTVRAVWLGLIHFAEPKQADVGERPWYETAHNVCNATYTGFLAAVLTLPLDTVKTKFQVSCVPTTIKDVFLNELRTYGIKHFWCGFTVYLVRLVVHTLVTDAILEKVLEKYIAETQEIKR